MKILKIIGIIAVALVAIVLLLMATLSGKAHVERSIVINANPEEVYGQIITFEEFNAWSPWYERDTTTQYSYEGPHHGVGAKMTWTSNHPEVGNGAMWIVETEVNKMVNNRMQFGDYPGEPYAYFYLEPVAEGTKVTWTYDEELEGIWKVMALFMDMDAMLGPDYERGLEKLKSHVESANNNIQEEESDIVGADSEVE